MIVMDKQNNIDTLEQMRGEMVEFKTLLAQQKIVSDKMMRRAMQNDYSKVRKSTLLSATLSIIGLGGMAAITFAGNVLPVWFFAVTVVYMLSTVGFGWYTACRYLSDDLMEGEVVSVAENILTYKNVSNRWLVFYGIPSLVVWVAVFFWLICASAGEFVHWMIIGGIAGLVIGGVCGLIYYVGYLRRINRLLQQIEELKGNM